MALLYFKQKNWYHCLYNVIDILLNISEFFVIIITFKSTNVNTSRRMTHECMQGRGANKPGIDRFNYWFVK